MPEVSRLFISAAKAIQDGRLIRREGRKDKEFHFQNWFTTRLSDLGLNHDAPGRNTYPDFTLVDSAEGYELKGLAYPGREATYDCNSQVPRGEHNGRQVYYVFGRYPKDPDGDEYPVLDLVICHGSFLNANNSYVHKNRSFRGFGSYGDIMVRDRKMYVAPTPFALVEGAAHRRTLILPEHHPIVAQGLRLVGTLKRREVSNVTVAYDFDLRTNVIKTQQVPNPTAGVEHVFHAYRVQDDAADQVRLRDPGAVMADLEAAVVEEDQKDE